MDSLSAVFERSCLTCANQPTSPSLDDIRGECWTCSSSQMLGGGVLPRWKPMIEMTLSPDATVNSFEMKEMPPGAVGDVNSTARGSGARYNAGKTPLNLIPLGIIARSYPPDSRLSPDQTKARLVLEYLGSFQKGLDEYLDAALIVLRDHWKECAEVFDFGRKKYAEWNWAKGMAWSIPLGCAARHLKAVLDGEDIDPESQKHHMGHALSNVVMLAQFKETYPEGDDRPKFLSLNAA